MKKHIWQLLLISLLALILSVTAFAAEEYICPPQPFPQLTTPDFVSPADESNYQTWYDQLYNGMKNYTPADKAANVGIRVDCTNSAKIQELFAAITFDHAELFYFSTTCQYTYSNYGTYYKVYPIFNPAFDTQEEFIEGKATFDAAVKDVADQCITTDMSDMEKVLAVHDWLAIHIKYDHAAADDYTSNHNAFCAYGAIVDNLAVCQGYSTAMNVILRIYGNIDCIAVTSTGHAWNMVKLDGLWYNVDATWNHPDNWNVGMIYHKYFMLTTDEVNVLDTQNAHLNGTNSHGVVSATSYTGDKPWSVTTYLGFFYNKDKKGLINVRQNGNIYKVNISSEFVADQTKIGSMDSYIAACDHRDGVLYYLSSSGNVLARNVITGEDVTGFYDQNLLPADVTGLFVVGRKLYCFTDVDRTVLDIIGSTFRGVLAVTFDPFLTLDKLPDGSMSLKNTAVAGLTIYCVEAAYDGSGKQTVCLISDKLTIAAGQTAEYTVTGFESAAKVKFFFVTDGKYAPVSEEIEY